jgi:hypothetical protein
LPLIPLTVNDTTELSHSGSIEKQLVFVATVGEDVGMDDCPRDIDGNNMKSHLNNIIAVSNLVN